MANGGRGVDRNVEGCVEEGGIKARGQEWEGGVSKKK